MSILPRSFGKLEKYLRFAGTIGNIHHIIILNAGNLYNI
jgi:hypothetical protein